MILTLLNHERKKVIKLDCQFEIEEYNYRKMEQVAKDLGLATMVQFVGYAMNKVMQAHCAEVGQVKLESSLEVH